MASLLGRISRFRSRENALQRFRDEVFDLLIIGGGITGAATARDAALARTESRGRRAQGFRLRHFFAQLQAHPRRASLSPEFRVPPGFRGVGRARAAAPHDPHDGAAPAVFPAGLQGRQERSRSAGHGALALRPARVVPYAGLPSEPFARQDARAMPFLSKTGLKAVSATTMPRCGTTCWQSRHCARRMREARRSPITPKPWGRSGRTIG